MSDEDSANIKATARDIRELLLLVREVVKYMKEAESEVPEKMRRFMMYMHDMHDISYMYEERGLAVPSHILREMERCDDRLRHLLDDAVSDKDGRWLEKVRADMTKRSGNRWDHSALLPKMEKTDETGSSE